MFFPDPAGGLAPDESKENTSLLFNLPGNFLK